MELDNILSIREVTIEGSINNNSEIGTYMVNELLESGYKLINTYITCYDEKLFAQQQTIHYVLGITNTNKED
ncbi:hypothetical protein [Clostridium psychrophilum]|uniref:hypothetical protein n=1 Tax=Clostridium psychrophilum TaxID=132926 RepID=UPI001C0B9BE2|nr:hypothetical protein [Clostridium psychrophilum]MBU3182440.1 hypothetical protein [Clostridium psychrophilum]